MKSSSIAIVVLSILPVVAACNKKPGDAKSGSGSAAAGSSMAGSATMTGSATTPASGSATAMAGSAAGSATPAAGSAAGSGAGSAAAVVVPEGKMVAINDNAPAGTYDGTSAIYFKDGKDRTVLLSGGDCKLKCDVTNTKDGLDYTKGAKECPGATWVTIDLNGNGQEGEPKVGPTKISAELGHFTGGQGLTSDWTDGGTLTEVTADHISGKVDMKDGGSQLHGTFVAKACK